MPVKHSAIRARREKVARHLVKGVPEARIAELVGVHRCTVARDMAHIRGQARDWLDNLAADDGFIHEYRLALEKIRDHEFELQKLLNEADTVAQKVRILQALDENVKLYLELLGETPAVHAYRRAMRKLQEIRRKPDAQAA